MPSNTDAAPAPPPVLTPRSRIVVKQPKGGNAGDAATETPLMPPPLDATEKPKTLGERAESVVKAILDNESYRFPISPQLEGEIADNYAIAVATLWDSVQQFLQKSKSLNIEDADEAALFNHLWNAFLEQFPMPKDNRLPPQDNLLRIGVQNSSYNRHLAEVILPHVLSLEGKSFTPLLINQHVFLRGSNCMLDTLITPGETTHLEGHVIPFTEFYPKYNGQRIQELEIEAVEGLAHFHVGMRFQINNELRRAADCFGIAASIIPDFATAWNLRGLTLIGHAKTVGEDAPKRKEILDSAEEAFLNAIKADKKFHAHYITLTCAADVDPVFAAVCRQALQKVETQDG